MQSVGRAQLLREWQPLQQESTTQRVHRGQAARQRYLIHIPCSGGDDERLPASHEGASAGEGGAAVHNKAAREALWVTGQLWRPRLGRITCTWIIHEGGEGIRAGGGHEGAGGLDHVFLKTRQP